MDYIGLIRRFAGLGGIVLVYLGITSEEEVSAATLNLETVVGGVLFLADFGKSVFGKIFKS